MKKRQSIYFSAQFNIKILKILGLASYSLDMDSFKIKTGVRNYFEFFLAVLIWIALFCRQWKASHDIPVEVGARSFILDNLWLYNYLFQHLLAIVTVIFNFIKRQHVGKFLWLVYSFDHKVHQLGWKFNVEHSRIFNPCFILATFVFNLVYIITTVFIFDLYKDRNFEMWNLFNLLSYVVITEFYLVLYMQFILSTYCIYTRLKAL